MKDGDSVTWGGSETFKETGMKAALDAAGTYRMLDRGTATTPEEQRAMWRDRRLGRLVLHERQRPHPSAASS